MSYADVEIVVLRRISERWEGGRVVAKVNHKLIFKVREKDGTNYLQHVDTNSPIGSEGIVATEAEYASAMVACPYGDVVCGPMPE